MKTSYFIICLVQNSISVKLQEWFFEYIFLPEIYSTKSNNASNKVESQVILKTEINTRTKFISNTKRISQLLLMQIFTDVDKMIVLWSPDDLTKIPRSRECFLFPDSHFSDGTTK